jgi:hypothetical protein
MRGCTNWRWREITRYVASSLLLGLLSCGNSSGVDGRIRPSIGVVYGWLTGAAGEPLEQAVVEAFVIASRELCVEPREELLDPVGTAMTDEGGYYAAELEWAHVSEMTLCVAVRVTPAGAGDEAAEMFLAGELTFRHETLTPPVDSLRFDATVSG